MYGVSRARARACVSAKSTVVSHLWSRALGTVSDTVSCADMVMNTPVVLLDEKILNRNIRNMQSIATQHGVRLRPHIKTHKSVELANMQIQQGSCGVTCSKPDEACVFLEAGMDTLLAYPVLHIGKIQKVIRTALQTVTLDGLTMMADSIVGVEKLGDVLDHLTSQLVYDTKLKVMIKIDVGLHRCGLNVDRKEDCTALISMLNYINGHPHMTFQGIMSHAGMAYSATSRHECISMANNESALMRLTKSMIEKSGFSCPIVSVGCTLTEWVRTDFDGIDEIRPGNYVFNDMKPLELGLIQPEDIALSVLAAVVSVNPNYVLIDAGSKVMSSDKGAHGSSGSSGYGTLWKVGNMFDIEAKCLSKSLSNNEISSLLLPSITENLTSAMTLDKLSEEHGWISVSQYPSARNLKRGDLVRILPNHSCVVANLATNYVVFDSDTKTTTISARKIAVNGRGAVQ